MYADPLEFFEIPGLKALVTPASNYLGYYSFPDHASKVVLAAVVYQVIFLLSGILSPILLPSYKTLSAKTRVNFDIHVVSHVQAIFILAVCTPLFGDKVLALDRVNAETPYSFFVSSMALGYFLWDSYICIKYYSLFGFGFLLHGLAAFFVFAQSMRPMLLFYGPHFLYFELSTPFLNVNWFASHLPDGTISFTVQKINGIFLLATFFTVRIVWGFYQAVNVAYDVFILDGPVRTYPLWAAIGILIANFSLNFLNVFWFYKMLRLAKRAIQTGAGRATKKNE